MPTLGIVGSFFRIVLRRWFFAFLQSLPLCHGTVPSLTPLRSRLLRPIGICNEIQKTRFLERADADLSGCQLFGV